MRLPLIFPVWVHGRGASIHLLEVLEAILAANHMFSDKVKQPVIPRTAAHKLFAVEVAASFPGRNGLQGRGLGCSNEPLNNTEM